MRPRLPHRSSNGASGHDARVVEAPPFRLIVQWHLHLAGEEAPAELVRSVEASVQVQGISADSRNAARTVGARVTRRAGQVALTIEAVAHDVPGAHAHGLDVARRWLRTTVARVARHRA